VRSRELRQPSVEEEWTRILPRVEAPNASPAEIEALVSKFPANARAFAEV